MAEIGLAASIISVAAFGASVATTLYETADIMKNANQQIRALAKHVTQFTAVLNHMGQVLKTEKTNCSKEVIRDIRKIKHSCKRTFSEIKSTVKAKRFPSFMWLFKRTKAMELEARLDSQQSMLQCMIHTLTVSRLSNMDSRSKKDSEHITGLKVEIKLLKTFIKESYDNLIALRRAEQSTEAEVRYQPLSRDATHLTTHHPYMDSSTFPSDPISAPNAFEPPITRSSSPTSKGSKSDNEDSNTDDGGDDDDHNDVSSTKSKDQNDHDGTGPKGDASSAKELISGVPYLPRLSYSDSLNPDIYRESNLLLQMVPYRPSDPEPIRSDRLISRGHGPDSGTTSATQEVTKSVRLLLDKWTTSGSAPISNILEEEAAREKDEAELANKHRISDPQFDGYRRSSSPAAEFNEADFGPTLDPGEYGYSHRFQDGRMPASSPWNNPQPSYGSHFHREMDLSRPFHNLLQPPSRQLGSELLTILRSARGGIHYTKSSNFKQVYYVDQYPIYTCTFVPSHMIPYNEDQLLNTELGRGLIRREALDLLAYSYIETETGNYSISGDLGLGEIEEIVRLSYQALERNLEERSKTVINERGLGEAINAMNRGVPGMRSNEPWTAPQYPPPRPEYWNQQNPLYDRYVTHRPYTGYENIWPDESTPAQAPLPHLHTREHPSARRRARPIVTQLPIESGLQEQDTTKTTRPEVRFTIPRAQLVSGTADTAKRAQTKSAKPDVPTTKTDNELQSVRQRLERAKKRKEEAEKARDIPTAFDLTSFVIPDIEAELEKVLKRQREEREKSSPPVSQNEEDKIFRHTEVETESEYSHDEGGSEAEALHD